ncbi:MAG: YtxH domain-containing protein [Chloroflexota bacterium]|nr:YtxH domain-containing protein [Chloroflexota bacterium]
MFGHINTALRFFVIGLATGVLIAPRAGRDTRNMVRRRFESIANDVLGIAGMPSIETSDSPDGGERRRGRGRRSEDPGAATSGT